MTEYFAESRNTDFKALLRYDEAGQLQALEFHSANEAQISYMCMLLSKDSSAEHIAGVESLKLYEAEQDLSFAAFWAAFKYKVGKKARAERLWNAMPEADRQAVFVKIPSYHQFIAIMNQNSAYPETWLNNRMWENEYRFQ